MTELKLLIRNCNYCEGYYPGLMRDKIAAGIQSDVVRKKLLSENKLTVEKAINICRASEKASEGMESLKNDEQSEVQKGTGVNELQGVDNEVGAMFLGKLSTE